MRGGRCKNKTDEQLKELERQFCMLVTLIHRMTFINKHQVRKQTEHKRNSCALTHVELDLSFNVKNKFNLNDKQI